MPAVAFKDLCIDVTSGGGRPARVAAFWGVALDQPVVAGDAGAFHLDPPPGGPRERRVWINAVPEPPSGKTRVHLDIRLLPDGDPASLVAAGGRVVRRPDAEISWHVVDDPDGVALCVMGPHPEHPDAPPGPFELVVDSANPERIASWWAERTDGTVGRRPGAPFAWVEGAAGVPFLFWVFVRVPEPKTVKNRVHWDVKVLDGTIDDLCAAGATLVHPKNEQMDWWVMADPEGNEFCAFE